MTAMVIIALVWSEKIEIADNNPPRFSNEDVCANLYSRIHRAKQKLIPTPEPELVHTPDPEPIISDERKRQLGIRW